MEESIQRIWRENANWKIEAEQAMDKIKERKENCREMAYLQALEEASGGPRLNAGPATPLVHASLCTQSAGPRFSSRHFPLAGKGPRKNLTARFAAFG